MAQGVNNQKSNVLIDDKTGLRYKELDIPDLSAVTEDTETLDQLPTKKVKLYDTLAAHRLDTETHEEYRIRRRVNSNAIKKYLKGNMFWNSLYMGTLENEKLKQRLEKLQNQKKLQENGK